MDRSPQQRVVITGIGVVSCLGIGREAFWNALGSGVSGVAPPSVFDLGTLPIPVVGEVRDFEPGNYIKARKSIKLMARETQLACASASLAMDDTGTDNGFPDDRFGVVFGSEMLYGPPVTLKSVFASSIAAGAIDMGRWGESFPREMSPLWLLNYLPNMPACHMGIAHRALGPCNSIVQGDVSGLLALIEAVSVIQRGWADVMLVGSVGNMICPTRQIYLAHDHLVNRTVADPATACRPFDATSSGVIPAEGAASFVIESLASAKARGATPYAEIIGFASAWGPMNGRCQKSHQNIARCIRQALQSANITADQVGHVNANGTGSLNIDRPEAQAINEVLGDTPVTALKSYMGSAGAGGGALGTVASALALHDNLVPPILNFHHPDPQCPIHAIRDEPMQVHGKAAVVLGQSITGQIATVVLQPV